MTHCPVLRNQITAKRAMPNQHETTHTVSPTRLEWGGLRAYDARLRDWAQARVPYYSMARRLSHEFGIAVTGQGVRGYCLREGFSNRSPHNAGMNLATNASPDEVDTKENNRKLP